MADRSYLSGFGNALHSEALPGAIPARQNAPREVPYGLYPEQLNGVGFGVQAHLNLRSWLYRLRPAVLDQPWERVGTDQFVGDFSGALATPETLRWRGLDLPQAPTDWLAGLTSIVGAGHPELKKGMAAHVYRANTSMERAFVNIDGDFVLAPELGDLRLQTEFGWLDLAPGEIAILPRGIKFRVHVDGPVRGFVGEVYDGHFQLPEHGLIGPNGLADARHFLAPTAAYEDGGPTEIVLKQAGQLWRATQAHSPFDVVGWHGNYTPFKYDLMNFASFGSVSVDHPDPSILTALTVPMDAHGRSAIDVVVFRGRWDPTEGTFRPPFAHRNGAVEFNMVIKTPAKTGPYQAGAFSMTPYMSPHAVKPASYAAASKGTDKPVRLSDASLWLQFETTYLAKTLPWALEATERDRAFVEDFRGYPPARLP